MKFFADEAGVLGAEPLGVVVAEDLAMRFFCFLKRRCPFGDGHDNWARLQRPLDTWPLGLSVHGHL